MNVAKGGAARAGRTDKLSVSLVHSDVLTLRKRARRLYDGNLSAVIAEGVRLVREQEGREALVAWLGETAKATPEQQEAIRAEWRSPATSTRRGRRPAA